jgi:hypothetical protein
MKIKNYKTTFHRDRTVTLWNADQKRWQRLMGIQIEMMPKLIASLTENERKRIAIMAKKDRIEILIRSFCPKAK